MNIFGGQDGPKTEALNKAKAKVKTEAKAKKASQKSKASSSSTPETKPSAPNSSAPKQTDDQLLSVIQSYEQKEQNNAYVTASGLRRSGSFAMAVVGYKTSSSHNMYRINKDGSVTRIAALQTMDSIIFMQLRQAGMSLENIASLSDMTVGRFQDLIANQCKYAGGDAPGFNDGSFYGIQTKGQWALDDNAVCIIKDKLTTVITSMNTSKSDKIICVSAQSTPNAQVSNPNVNVITSFNVWFITKNGNFSSHAITFTTDMSFNQTVTLDGKRL